MQGARARAHAVLRPLSGAMAAGWEELLKAAEKALREDPPKFFDGVQHINTAMETFAKDVLEDETGRVTKEPADFLRDLAPGLQTAHKDALRRMFEVRGDVITGLGAHKRAAVDYQCAADLSEAQDQASVLSKRSRAEQAAKGPRTATDKVPVTVITGFLGSGKTTLLNRILKDQHGKRIGIIENEFGEVGIDDGLIDSRMTTEENIVEMNNGCICCTVRGDLIAGLKKFIKSSQKSGKLMDAVIIETTGLADPAPVAQTFFADEFVQQKMYLDGILTLVDAKHIVGHLDEEKPEGVENEAVEQVAFADRILLNKCDLVEEADLAEVERRIRRINEAVRIKRTRFSEVDMDFVLGIKAFSLDKILEMDDTFLQEDQEHQHDDRVSSVGFHVSGEVDQSRLNDWIGWLLREKGGDIFRTKGILAVQGMKDKFVFQAVHMAFSGAPQKPWADGEERECKLTFIGKNLNRQELVDGFMECLVK